MLPTLAFGLLFVGTAVVYALAPRPRGGTWCAIAGGVTLLSGTVGLVLSMITTVFAVRQFPPAEQYAVRMSGFSEALNNLSLALILIVLGSLIAAAGALRTALRTQPAEDER